MADDARPPLDQDDVVRVPLDLLREPGVTVAIIRVYGAIRARVGFEPAADNFLVAWPSVTTIAKDAGLHRASVMRAIRWLDDHDYVVHQRRPNRSSTYLINVWRTSFQRVASEHGRAEAIRALLDRMADLGGESRSAQAKGAWERKSRGEQASGRKSPGGDRPDDGGDGRSQGGDVGGRSGATSRVAGVRPRTVVQENCATGNRGAAEAALPLAPEGLQDEDESNGKATDPDRSEIMAMVANMAKRSAMPAASPTEEQREARIRELRAQTEDWT